MSSGYWGRSEARRRREEVEVVIVEKFETKQLPLVIWRKRLCPFCDSEDIEVYGKTKDRERRYYRCESCRQNFVVLEQ